MKNNWIFASIICIVLALSFFGGYQYRKLQHHCPIPVSDTVLVYDSVPHIIYDTLPWYHIVLDTIIYDSIQYNNIDTTAIIKDYFAKHVYDRKWENDTLLIKIQDTITQNTSIGNKLNYTIKIPFSTVNNNYYNVYKRYLYGGIAIYPNNYNFSQVELMYGGKNIYTGLSYMPFQKAYLIHFGINILNRK